MLMQHLLLLEAAPIASKGVPESWEKFHELSGPAAGSEDRVGSTIGYRL